MGELLEPAGYKEILHSMVFPVEGDLTSLKKSHELLLLIAMYETT